MRKASNCSVELENSFLKIKKTREKYQLLIYLITFCCNFSKSEANHYPLWQLKINKLTLKRWIGVNTKNKKTKQTIQIVRINVKVENILKIEAHFRLTTDLGFVCCYCLTAAAENSFSLSHSLLKIYPINWILKKFKNTIDISNAKTT